MYSYEERLKVVGEALKNKEITPNQASFLMLDPKEVCLALIQRPLDWALRRNSNRCIVNAFITGAIKSAK